MQSQSAAPGYAQYSQPVASPAEPATYSTDTSSLVYSQPAQVIQMPQEPQQISNVTAIDPVVETAEAQMPSDSGLVAAQQSAVAPPPSAIIPQPPAQNAVQQQPQAPVTPQPNPAILELANNNDLNVATIAREAKARSPGPSRKAK